MTAEIALINKLAVTLAADSAVTIGSSDGSKVYNSADKIFEATNFDPIGVMVYNNPELNGIPVEAIIKMFRDKVCISHFPTVFEFSEEFLRHLETIDTPPITITQNITALINEGTLKVREDIRSITSDFLQSAEKFETMEEFREGLEGEINAALDGYISLLIAEPEQDWAKGLSEADVLSHHGNEMSEFVGEVFSEDNLPEERKAKILSWLSWFLLRGFQRATLTGLVFAGFGKDEIFPSLVSYEIYGIVAGKLKFQKVTTFNVDRKLIPDAAVIPFAQKEMVDRFMYGIDEEFLDMSNSYFTQSHQMLKDRLPELLSGAAPEAIAAANEAVDTILGEFAQQVLPEHITRLRGQFSDMVRSMPKQELAALAESLVHITSLKRKFSAGAESVGGPIDVAMVTRAEGFVWVKRKHYFDPQFNPRYFHRRYGSPLIGQGDQKNG